MNEHEQEKPDPRVAFQNWKADLELRAAGLIHDEQRLGTILAACAFVAWVVWK